MRGKQRFWVTIDGEDIERLESEFGPIQGASVKAAIKRGIWGKNGRG